MSFLKNIKNWLEDQEHLFYLFLFILIVPNLVLCFTEPLPLMANPCYTMKPRVYLNDHNEPRPLDDLGMRKPDFRMLDRVGILF